jgi:hypothetical protein
VIKKLNSVLVIAAASFSSEKSSHEFGSYCQNKRVQVEEIKKKVWKVPMGHIY